MRQALPWAAAAAAALLITVSGQQLVRRIETYPFAHPDLRSDPTVDRARIAHNVYRDLRASPLALRPRLRMWSPASVAFERSLHPERPAPTLETYWESNVRTALLDGLAIRVLFPAVREVEFVREFGAADDSTLYALYLVDGRVRLVTPEEVAARLQGSPPPS